MDVQVTDGGKGEFAVMVDDREAVRKSGDSLPPADEVVSAVRRADQPAGARA